MILDEAAVITAAGFSTQKVDQDKVLIYHNGNPYGCIFRCVGLVRMLYRMNDAGLSRSFPDQIITDKFIHLCLLGIVSGLIDEARFVKEVTWQMTPVDLCDHSATITS